MKKFIYIFMAIAMVMIASCEREDIYDGMNDGQFINYVPGSWEVKAYLSDTLVFDTFTLFISESPANGLDSIMIQDTINNFWNFQVNAAVDKEGGTFQTKLSNNALISDYSIGVKIPTGKIIQSDSIYMEMQFEDDITPFGNLYQIKGHRVINGEPIQEVPAN